ncbi:protein DETOXIFICATION 16-like isoform X1 [Vigna unguiculata]|uniref:protein DETOXIFICATION 16-like isoform X1 n=1 Tax=Vigna unguiculata TaxID=3917 RepID=UPI0010165968|nr:protein DETOXIFICATION 16-like isoform X1 [Vigna unguiculata]
MRIRRREEVEELKRQLRLAVPLFSVGILQYILQTISVMFVGHLGTLPLDGATMATSFASVTGFNLLMGLATALDTFCGQSNGAGQYHMLGIYMQRSMLVVLSMSVFIAMIWANTEPILKAMHQDKVISEEAGSYARYMIPSLFAYGLLQCMLKFLQTQNIVLPMVVTSGIAAVLHVPFCWLLVFKSGLGSRGAALANSISYWVNAILIFLYVRFSSSCKQSWTGFSKMAFHNLPEFLKLAVPSALMLCLKVWTFELMVLMSGLLPNPILETSVLAICLNTFGLAWMIPFGFSAAVSIRVSNELGGGNPKAASVAVRVVLSMAFIEGMVLVSAMILLRNVWGHVYSNDKEVIRYVSFMMPTLAISSFLDGIQSALSGILAGCGWQKIGACVNLASFYVVGVPSAVVLAFVVHMKAKGLWLGIILAFVVQVLFYIVIAFRTDMEEQARKAQSRVERSAISPTTRECVIPH